MDKLRSSQNDSKIIVPIPVQKETIIFYNDGIGYTPQWENFDASVMWHSVINAESNYGSYTTTFYLVDKENYIWEDYTTEDKTVTWRVLPRQISYPQTLALYMYDGASQSVYFRNISEQTDMSGTTSAINPGTYPVYITPKSNRVWVDGGSEQITVYWTIEKANPNLILDKYSLSFTAGGGSQQDSIEATYTGDGVLSAISSDSSIVSAQIDGKLIRCTAYGNGVANINISLSETSNYKSDFTTIRATVNAPTKNQGSISVNISDITFYSYLDEITIQATRTGTGLISASGYDPSIIDVSISGTSITVKCMSQSNAITTSFYLLLAETSEYTSASTKVSVTIYNDTLIDPDPDSSPIEPWFLSFYPSTRAIILTGNGTGATGSLVYPGNGQISVNIPSAYLSYINAQINQSEKIIYFSQTANVVETFNVQISVSADTANGYPSDSLSVTVMMTFRT